MDSVRRPKKGQVTELSDAPPNHPSHSKKSGLPPLPAMPILGQQRRIDHHMPDAQALPRVEHVHQTIGRLDHRGIRELRAGFVFEGEHLAPVDAVAGDRDGEVAAAVPPVLAVMGGVVDQQGAAVVQHHRIDAGVRVADVEQLQGRPGLAAVVRPGAEESVLFGAADRLQASVGPGQQAGLDGVDVVRVGNGVDRFPVLVAIDAAFDVDVPAASSRRALTARLRGSSPWRDPARSGFGAAHPARPCSSP